MGASFPALHPADGGDMAGARKKARAKAARSDQGASSTRGVGTFVPVPVVPVEVSAKLAMPPALVSLHRACWVARSIANAPTQQVIDGASDPASGGAGEVTSAADVFLEHVCRAAAELGQGSLACAWVARPPVAEEATQRDAGAPKTPWLVESAGVWPASAGGEALREAARGGWAEDDVSPARGRVTALGQSECWARSDQVAHRAWEASRCRRWRAGAGLHELARGMAPMVDADGPRTMIVQLDGLTARWQPDAVMLGALHEATLAAAEAYSRGFLSLRRRRFAMLAVLSVAQQQVAPLLAGGLPERAIGRIIERSAHTVHEHSRAICRAWGVRSRLELRDAWNGVQPSEAFGL